MTGVTIQQMAGRVAELMEARLRVRGNSLAEKLERGGRLLPRRVRRKAEFLARSATEAQVPKLQVRLDHERATSAYDDCVRYLRPLGGGTRRRALVLDMLTGVVGAVFVTLALIVMVLVWRGYL